MPFPDVALAQQKVHETSFMSLKLEEEGGFVASLNQVVNAAIGKIHANTLIKQIQIVLKDSEKDEHEKFIVIAQMVDQSLKDKTLKDPLSYTFYQLFKKEVLDFFSQEIKDAINKSKNELLTRLANLYKRLAGKMIKPSLLRDLLVDLKELTQRCAEKNRWAIPTGIKQLRDLLSSLDWMKDEELPKILRDCKKVIADRLKCSYLSRGALTFFLYRNFYPILASVSGIAFDAINSEISCASERALVKHKATINAFTHLYLWLHDLKNDINAASLNNKGKILGIFAKKPSDGIYRLRIILNKLPPDFHADDESQVLLITIFMQIKEILLEKAVFSNRRPFRAPEVNALYQRLHAQIQILYTVLSEYDKEVFNEVYRMEEGAEEAVARLAIPKGYAILANPEKMSEELEKMLKLFEPAANETTLYEPSCSH